MGRLNRTRNKNIINPYVGIFILLIDVKKDITTQGARTKRHKYISTTTDFIR